MKKFDSLFDRFFPIFFILSLCLLMFVVGQAAMHFRWTPYYMFKEAVHGGKAWLNENEKDKKPQKAGPIRAFSTKVVLNKKGAFEGYTLLIPRASARVRLVDMEGNEVHRWTVPVKEFMQKYPSRSKSPIFTFLDATVLPNGDLIATFMRRGETPAGYALARLDKDSKPIWVNVDNNHHYLYRSPEEGNDIYELTHHFVKRPLSEATVKLRYPFMDDFITIVSDEGKTKKSISLVHAFFDTPHDKLLKKSTGNGWDLMHTNSVMRLEKSMADKFPLFKAGYVLVSMREINTLAVVDPDSGKVVWTQRGPWKRQHNARFLPNGNIMVLDNRGGVERYSRVIEFDPVTGRTVWEYDGNKENGFKTNIFGKLQRLDNGNTLICNCTRGSVLEVTPDKEMVWKIKLFKSKKQDMSHAIFSMHRYGKDELTFLKDKPVPLPAKDKAEVVEEEQPDESEAETEADESEEELEEESEDEMGNPDEF